MLSVKHFTFSPVLENTYVIFNEKGNGCIIDPGCYSSEERAELKAFIEEREITLKYLLNTHCHLDHVFGNRFIHETYGLTLHLHKKEKPVLDFAPASGQMWGLPFENYSGPFTYLEEGGTVKIDEDTFSILFTPGHSPGHIAFYCSEQSFIVSGDVLFQMSIGRTDLPGGDHETLLKNIREKLFTLPGDVIVYPGHGSSTTIGFEKENNPFFK